ncbi:MAG: hypothetical protein ABSG53_13500 [Thermoguttaceae bacterium]|jgi:hypothetical protein
MSLLVAAKRAAHAALGNLTGLTPIPMVMDGVEPFLAATIHYVRCLANQGQTASGPSGTRLRHQELSVRGTDNLEQLSA